MNGFDCFLGWSWLSPQLLLVPKPPVSLLLRSTIFPMISTCVLINYFSRWRCNSGWQPSPLPERICFLKENPTFGCRKSKVSYRFSHQDQPIDQPVHSERLQGWLYYSKFFEHHRNVPCLSSFFQWNCAQNLPNVEFCSYKLWAGKFHSDLWWSL